MSELQSGLGFWADNPDIPPAPAPAPKSKFTIPDHTGHSTFEFDKLDPASLYAAAEKFEALRKEGRTAVEKKPHGGSEVIRAFNPNAEETLFIAPLAGG